MTETAVPMSLRVLNLRKKLGLTQQELAERLGVTQATVNRWEREKKHPSPLAEHLLAELEAAAEAGKAELPETSWGSRRQGPTLVVQLNIQLPAGASEQEMDTLLAKLGRRFPALVARGVLAV